MHKKIKKWGKTPKGGDMFFKRNNDDVNDTYPFWKVNKISEWLHPEVSINLIDMMDLYEQAYYTLFGLEEIYRELKIDNSYFNFERLFESYYGDRAKVKVEKIKGLYVRQEMFHFCCDVQDIIKEIDHLFSNGNMTSVVKIRISRPIPSDKRYRKKINIWKILGIR